MTGCVYNDEPMPEITKRLSANIPDKSPSNPVTNHDYTSADSVPRDWCAPSNIKKGWSAIIIHHSATDSGNSAIFDRWHKQGRHWEGVGYDFVIGNGSDSADGQVEVTFRWKEQKTGAHCGGTPGNWANEKGIGICLVGDFNKTRPTHRQMASLLKLIRFLQNQYKIPVSQNGNVTGFINII